MPLPHYNTSQTLNNSITTPLSFYKNDFNVHFILDDLSNFKIICKSLDYEMRSIKIEWLPDNIDFAPTDSNLQKIKFIFLNIDQSNQLIEVFIKNFSMSLSHSSTDLLEVDLFFAIKNKYSCDDNIKSVIRNIKLDKLI